LLKTERCYDITDSNDSRKDSDFGICVEKHNLRIVMVMALTDV